MAHLNEKNNGVSMRDQSDKIIWGKIEKIGKGTRANYDPARKQSLFASKEA